MQVIETEEHAVCHPVVPSKNPLHLRQEYAVPEERLAQDVIEQVTDQDNSQEPPLPLKLGGNINSLIH